jgi:hypothetical protein
MNWFKDKKEKASTQAKELRTKARESWQNKYGQTNMTNSSNGSIIPSSGTPFGIPLREATNASKSTASGFYKVPAVVFRCIECIVLPLTPRY